MSERQVPQPSTTPENKAGVKHSKKKAATAKKGEQKNVNFLAWVGGTLLVIALLAGITSMVSIKNFSEGSGQSVKADKEYTLLVDGDALQATSCTLENPDGSASDVSLVDFKPAFNMQAAAGETQEIADISLPLTEGKGIYASTMFSKDAENLLVNCNTGTMFISGLSQTFLNVLYWLALLAFVAGMVILAAFFFLLRPSSSKKTGDDATKKSSKGSKKSLGLKKDKKKDTSSPAANQTQQGTPGVDPQKPAENTDTTVFPKQQ